MGEREKAGEVGAFKKWEAGQESQDGGRCKRASAEELFK